MITLVSSVGTIADALVSAWIMRHFFGQPPPRRPVYLLRDSVEMVLEHVLVREGSLDSEQLMDPIRREAWIERVWRRIRERHAGIENPHGVLTLQSDLGGIVRDLYDSCRRAAPGLMASIEEALPSE